MRHGLCLHFGEVLYGNVGSSERLDFTIIGQPVNVAERVVEATKELKVDYLCTRDFVGHFGDRGLMPVSTQGLSDSSGPAELFTLVPDQSQRGLEAKRHKAMRLYAT